MAPTVAETVASANSPGYLFPVLLPLFVLVYGFPVLLIRELWARGRVGWPGFAVLALTYGALNEGVVAATWSKLSPPDDQVLVFGAEQVGRTGGVNVALVAGLTLFHAVWAVVVPIVLVEAWSRQGRGRPWLPKWACWVATATVIFLTIGSVSDESNERTCEATTAAIFDECVRGRRGSVLLIAAGVVLALVLPRWRPRVPRRRRTRPSRTGILLAGGASYAVLFLVSFFALPLNDQPTAAVVAHGTLVGVAALVIYRRRAASAHEQVLLATGTLLPGMAISILRVLVLQPIVVAAFVVLFLRPAIRRTRDAATALGRSPG